MQSNRKLVMSPEIRAALIGAAVAILIGGGTIWYQREAVKAQEAQIQLEREKTAKAEEERDEARRRADTYRKLLEDAPTKFTTRLGQLIDEASKESNRKEGPSQLVPAAKALVSARDGFRSDLESVKDRLDSEIDQLSRELSREPPDMQKITELVEILKRKWPAKKEEIELALRKLMAELGLVQIFQPAVGGGQTR